MLSSGLEVRITEAEMHAMRAIFGLFDRDGSGTISAADLRALHQKLGEPITEEEAKDAVRDIGQGRDVITFDDFVMYWDGTHPSLRATVTANPVVAAKFKYTTGAGAAGASAAPSSAVVSRASSFDGADVLASALPSAGGLPSASHGAGAGGFMLSPSVDAATRERKRQWYQARFKFLRAKLANPTVARVYAEEAGAPCTLEWRLRFFYDAEDGRKVQISPWHDIPYKNDNGTYNMLVEIPKWSRRKYEVATGEPFNNVKQVRAGAAACRVRVAAGRQGVGVAGRVWGLLQAGRVWATGKGQRVGCCVRDGAISTRFAARKTSSVPIQRRAALTALDPPHSPLTHSLPLLPFPRPPCAAGRQERRAARVRLRGHAV